MNTNKKNSALRIWIGGGLVLAVAAAGLLLMLFKQKTALARDTQNRTKEISDGPVVKVVKAGMWQGDKGLVLIGETRPFQSVTLYAKTSGYYE